jgi:NAD(P)-dependent dehydrogenase (short-subunit alcohol dehydrogenase family)
MTSEQKVVVITGASRGIGAQLSKAYRDIGYQVIASSRSMRKSDDPAILVIEGDITRPETAERILDTAAERFGRIDTLVNNAGVFIKPFTDYSEKDFATMIAVNLAGFFHLSQKAAAWMLRTGSGHIVNITATIAEQPVASLPAALAALTKGGLNAATRSLAIEYAPRHVRVNAVSAGATKTPMHSPEAYEFLSALQPIGRMGEMQEITDAVMYLEKAVFVTGRDPSCRRRLVRRSRVGGVRMWPDRRLVELFDIEHPIVLRRWRDLAQSSSQPRWQMPAASARSAVQP